MICPKCKFKQSDGLPECKRCGVIFAKLHDRRPADVDPQPALQAKPEESRQAAKELLLPLPKDISIIALAGQVMLLALLVVWSFKFVFASIESNYAGQSFLHLVNLPFHEAGHIIFSPFGRLVQALGGTLGQLLMPAICMAVLLLRTRDAFGAAVAQWWLAESFMDIAPYINDARSLDLILLGGVTGKDVEDYHDWEFILRKLGLLEADHFLAQATQLMGIVLMLAALGWAGANVWMRYKVYRANQKASLPPADGKDGR